MSSARIIIAGGGTGGHIFPAIAVAHALRKLRPDTEILFIGAKGKMEMEKVPEAGYRIEGIDIAGFDRQSLIRNLGLPFKLVKSFLQVRRIMRQFKPTAVVGVGGYSSFPVLRYAQQQGVPTFIHESNAFAGKANMFLGKKATKIFVAVSGMEKFFPADKIVFTGNPVRETISQSVITREEGLRLFGLSAEFRTILSVGGSLGARSINLSVEKGLNRIVDAGFQLIWQTGKPFADKGQQVSTGRRGVWTGAFIREMGHAYAAADLVISRAGALSIAELGVAGKPAILVPFPLAAEDHQTMNAKALVDQNAAVMIPDALAEKQLVDTALALLNDTDRLAELANNMAATGIKDADMVIANKIFELA